VSDYTTLPPDLPVPEDDGAARTGRPGQELPPGWDDIPGARGCTPQACSFRDHHADIAAHGARAGVIEHVIYPVFPPGSDAEEVVRWLSA
jgi:hypothetical protein